MGPAKQPSRTKAATPVDAQPESGRPQARGRCPLGSGFGEARLAAAPAAPSFGRSSGCRRALPGTTSHWPTLRTGYRSTKAQS